MPWIYSKHIPPSHVDFMMMNLIGFKKSRRYVFVRPQKSYLPKTGLNDGEELGTWFFKSYRHINPAKLAILGPTKPCHE